MISESGLFEKVHFLDKKIRETEKHLCIVHLVTLFAWATSFVLLLSDLHTVKNRVGIMEQRVERSEYRIKKLEEKNEHRK